LRIKEAHEVAREQFQWSSFKAFGKGSVLMVAVMGLIYALALDGVLTYLGDHVKNVLEVSLGNTSLLVALSMIGRIIGALSNSQVTDRIGHRQSLFVAIGLTSFACVGLALGGGVPLVALFAFLFGLAYGYYTSVYAAVAMEMSDPAIAASMFAIFMMFLNLGTVGGQALGGILTEKLQFGGMALVMGAVNLLNVLLVSRVFKRSVTRISP
jgi:PAT family beta-lactamase induction signal transducer AmpG